MIVLLKFIRKQKVNRDMEDIDELTKRMSAPCTCDRSKAIKEFLEKVKTGEIKTESFDTREEYLKWVGK